MIATLLRQDPAARNLPIYAAVGLLVGLLLRGLAAPLPEDLSLLSSNARGWMTFIAALAWFTSLQLVLSVNFMTRSSQMALSLPIRSRTVWWTRMVSLLYTGTIPILLATMVVALRVPAEGSGLNLEPLYLFVGAKAWAGVILATALFQSPWPSLQRIRPGADYVIYVACLAILVLLLVLLLPASPVTVLVLLALAAGLLLRLHLTVPAAFLLSLTELEEPDWVPPEARPSSAEPDPGPAKATAVEGAASPAPTGAPSTSSPLEMEGEIPERWLIHLTLFRLLVNHWQTWLIMPLTGFYAFLLVEAYYDGRDPFPNLLFITIWPMILTYQAIIRLHRVDHLPVSRRTILPYVVLPSLLSVLIGITFGWLITTPDRGGRCHVCYEEGELKVAPEYWAIAWDGVVPEIDSPWGETHTPRALPIFPGSRIAVYLPYEAGEESSARFRALQANRAVAAIHGEPAFSEEEIAADPENRLVAALSQREESEGSVSVEGSYGRGAPLKKRAWLLGGLAVGGIWSLLTLLLVLSLGASPFRWVYKVLYLVTIIGWGGILILYILGDLLGYFDPIMSARFFYILLRRLAAAVPLGPPVLVLLNLLVLGIGYLFVQAAFRGVEAPKGKVKPVWKEYG